MRLWVTIAFIISIWDIAVYDDRGQTNDEVFFQCSKKILFNFLIWPYTLGRIIRLHRRFYGQN